MSCRRRCGGRSNGNDVAGDFDRNQRHRKDDIVLDVDRVIVRADELIIRADDIRVEQTDNRRRRCDDVRGVEDFDDRRDHRDHRRCPWIFSI